MEAAILTATHFDVTRLGVERKFAQVQSAGERYGVSGGRIRRMEIKIRCELLFLVTIFTTLATVSYVFYLVESRTVPSG